MKDFPLLILCVRYLNNISFQAIKSTEQMCHQFQSEENNISFNWHFLIFSYFRYTYFIHN